MNSARIWIPVFAVFGAHAVWAQAGEFWVNGGGSVLANGGLEAPPPSGGPGAVHLGNGFRFGFRYTLNSAGHFAHEIQYGYVRTTFTDTTGTILPDSVHAGTAIHQAGYNVVYYMRETREEVKSRVFATAGFHVNDYVLPGGAIPQGSSVKPGANVGVGFKYRLSPLVGFRMDFRQYVSGKPDWSGVLVNPRGGLIYQTEITAGFGVVF